MSDQSRIRMEQSVDALSLKDVQLVFLFVYYAYLNDRLCQIYLFIFLCDTFPTVLTARC